MLKRIGTIVGGSVGGLALLFFAAGRPVGDLFGYFRAGASTTVKSIEREIPDAVHDEKTKAELAAARDQLVDRQVQLNLSQNQLKSLEHEIEALDKAVADRSQVLASAYPVLQNALDTKQPSISFVSTNFSLDEFQREVDDLLSMQQRDENALRIKRDGFRRLQQSVADGEQALTSMKSKMLEIEQEFAILKTRRDQARMEAETLDLVAGVTSAGKSSTANAGVSVDRLGDQVEGLEARNAARRDVASVDQRVTTGKLTQTFNRLEALKRYADQKPAANTSAVTSSNAPSTSANSIENSTPYDAKEVVIRIKGDEANLTGK